MPSHAHMYSDRRESSVCVNWTKQVCLQARLRWWKWWDTPHIIWIRVSDKRRSNRKRAITTCCLTVFRSIEKRHGVWAEASVASVWWLFLQHFSYIWWCSTAVAVVAQASYLYVFLTLTGSQWSDFKFVVMLDNFWRRKITQAA